MGEQPSKYCTLFTAYAVCGNILTQYPLLSPIATGTRRTPTRRSALVRSGAPLTTRRTQRRPPYPLITWARTWTRSSVPPPFGVYTRICISVYVCMCVCVKPVIVSLLIFLAWHPGGKRYTKEKRNLIIKSFTFININIFRIHHQVAHCTPRRTIPALLRHVPLRRRAATFTAHLQY